MFQFISFKFINRLKTFDWLTSQHVNRWIARFLTRILYWQNIQNNSS